MGTPASYLVLLIPSAIVGPALIYLGIEKSKTVAQGVVLALCGVALVAFATVLALGLAK